MSRKDFQGLDSDIVVSGASRKNPIDEDVQINAADLDYEFQTHPEKYAWWAFLAEHAKAETEALKNRLAVAYAQIDFKVRDKARHEEDLAKEQKRKPIRYTEKMVESEVLTSEEYQKLQTEFLESKKMAGLAAAGRAAMDHRRDMLIQIGANYRTEGQADPVLLKEAAKEKARERARQREQEKAQAQTKKKPPGKKVPGKPV